MKVLTWRSGPLQFSGAARNGHRESCGMKGELACQNLFVVVVHDVTRGFIRLCL